MKNKFLKALFSLLDLKLRAKETKQSQYRWGVEFQTGAAIAICGSQGTSTEFTGAIRTWKGMV